MWINTVLIIIILLCVISDFFLIISVYRRKHLKKEKAHLTKLLERSEESRIKTEAEKNTVTAIFNNFTDGIIIIDERDKITLINPEAIKILELDTEKLIGKSFQFMVSFKKAKPIVSILETGIKNICRKEIELEKNFIIEFSVIPLNLGKNAINHLLIIHDISKEKMIEKMKTEFVSLAAHQIRTPLSMIKWSMSMLKKGDFGKITKKQNDIIEHIYQSNEKLIYLVNDLLDMSHIEEGRYLFKTDFIDLRETLTLVMYNYKDRIKEKEIKVVFEKPDDFPQISADPEKIKLAVQNLIDNAIKYSSKKGKIIITLKNDEKNIELKVQDSGIGIPKNQQNKIFTEFFRGNNAVKENSSGSGLGLFLTRNIIEAHGGKIWFESEENKGTSFYFSLPIKKSAQSY
jgi:PAS domain S-box-containing protein